MLLFSKPTRKPKPKRKCWLKRSKKPIQHRSVFKGHYPGGSRKRRRTDREVMARALQYRGERLQNMTRAQIAFNGILDELGVLYECEAIILNGDRFIIIDALVRSSKVAFEIDGSAHSRQGKYDLGRDRWLLSVHSIRTVRITNEDIYRQPELVRQRVLDVLNCSHAR
jgi:Protein of unknown function (DUF559)